MTGVPSNIRVPFMGVDFDSSQASSGPEDMPIRILCIGQRLSTGTVAADTPFLATSAYEVATKAGLGSMLHRMAIYLFKNNNTVPVTFVGLDDATGTQASYAFTITGPATAAGTFACKIAGETYAASVVVGDTATEIGDALIALINADTNLQCTAANVTGTVTLTCRNDGVIAGDLDVRCVTGLFPTGVSVGSVTPTAGTVDPDLADALAAIGDEWYNVVVNPYTDNSVRTNVDTLDEWLDAQNDILVQQDAMAYQVVRDTLANLIAYAGTDPNPNSQFMATFDGENRLQSTYEIAAAIAGQVAMSVQQNTAVPLHRMTPVGIDSLDVEDRRTPTERNQLAVAGIATLTDGNGVQTDATVTMRLTNTAGAPSTVYQQQNTTFQLMFARYSFRNWILSRYPRALMADNADDKESGVQIMTPDIGETEAIAWFKYCQKKSVFEGGSAKVDEFIAALVVERDVDNVNRMNWTLPPNLMNQFIVGSATIQFRS